MTWATVPRAQLGGDIYAHGSAVSAGCLAIGDAAIERVFTVVALAQPGHRWIVIAPVDFLRPGAPDPPEPDARTQALYRRLRATLRRRMGR